MGMRTIATTLALLAALLGAVAPADAQPLRQDLGSYFVLALKSVQLKNMSLSGACNIGVDCGAPAIGGGQCGTMRTQALTLGPGSQLVADKVLFTKPGASVFQLFRNGGGLLNGVTINSPPVQSFTPPVIPGTCDGACTPDVTTIGQLCGFPDPFPACNTGLPITVSAGGECPGDTSPGNGQCDLPPGVYGNLFVRSYGAVLNLSAGTYTFCSVNVLRSSAVHGSGITLLVPDGGNVRVSNNSTFGDTCGGIDIFANGRSVVRFGHAATIAASVCAPSGKLSLGHSNQLLGRFVSNFINSDRGNQGMCCPTTTTTSATSTSTSSTSSTSTSTTESTTSTSTTESSTSTSTSESTTSTSTTESTTTTFPPD